MRKIILSTFFTIFSLTACDGWSYTIPTFPAPPPTITPSIFTITPLIVTATYTTTPFAITDTPTEIASESPTPMTPPDTATAITETPTSTSTATLPPVSSNITVEVLGCNTSIDITHSMGEVTNAFVTLKNKTGTSLANACTTLSAIDEGRVHPDKTVCVPILENGQQVTLKLTVDSTYRVETPIQIEVKDGEKLLARVGQQSCRDIGIFAPSPGVFLTPVPIE